MSEQGRKFDTGKLRYDLIPALALEEVVKVVTKGAEKYDDENWKLVPEGRRRYLAAAMRHIQQWRKGEIYDEEMGTHHIANAISNLMFILEKELQGWEDVPEVAEDISEQECVDYHQKLWKEGTIRPQSQVEQEKPWYPPVEDSGNPWVEWYPTPWGIYPNRVSESTVVDVLTDYERENKDFETSPQKARDWYWGDSSIVAYRVV